jgi:hypothetical protein
METAVKQRIKDFLKSKKVSLNSISAGDVAKKMALSRQINGDTSLSHGTISLLLETFPDLSAEWLLRGVGDMLTTTQTANGNAAPIYQNNGNGGNNVTQTVANAEIADRLLSRLEISQDQLSESLSQNKQLISIISKLTDK